MLDLRCVTIREHVLDNLFSTCKLLEKVNLSSCKSSKTIKVKNLCCFRELKINSEEKDDRLEIDDFLSLLLFSYC